jgi:hypothetical protein
MGEPVVAAYADCIDHDCPNCGAAAGDWCENPITMTAAAIPCVARFGAAGRRP